MTKPPGVIAGRIADRPVADLLQSMHESRRTGVARFRTALGTASIWFRDGELVDAEMGRFHQEAAVLRLLKIQDGEFEIELVPVPRRRAVKAATAQLLAEGRQRAPRPGRARAGQRRATLSESDANQAAARARRSPSDPRSREAPSAGSRAVSAARRATPVPPSEPRSPTPAKPVRRPTPSGGHTAARSRAPLPTDTDAHTTVARAPAGLPLDDIDVEEHPTIRAQIPRDSALARARRSSSDGHPVRARRPSSGDHPVRARRPSNGAHPVRARQPSSPDVATRRPSSGDHPVRARQPSGPDVAARRASSDDQPVRARKPSNPDIAAGSGSGPSRASRRRARGAASWSPTAGGDGARAPEPPPEPTPEPPAAESPTGSTGRTQFMFGVSGGPSPPARAPRFAGNPAAEPEEPSPPDRTLMMPGPVPPPSTAAPAAAARRSSSAPIDVSATPKSEPAPDAGETITYGAPTAIEEEEYSHPISVPTDPSNVGPGGTWVLDGRGMPAPAEDELDEADKTFVLRQEEPDATDKTFVLKASDIPQSRPSPVSAQVQAGAGGRTAQVGRYEVLLRLARGGMGTVYLCRITGEGGFRRLFALKVVREHLNRNQAYVDMLLREARIASRLDHPNVVPIIDIDTFAGQHFLVMDYVEGCNFADLLKAHPKSRPPALIIPIIVDALTGLHAAHTMRGDDGSIQPLVHCDVSPHNMLVGMNGTCRIIDFGVAKAADTLTELSDRGKPRYLAPEQVRGLPVDPRTDVFAAGIVLWNALTGEQLFEGGTVEQILHQVVSTKIPKPSTVGLRPPACFDRVCLKALDRDPGKRYQSAEQMLMDLRKVAIAEDMLAPSSEVGQWVLDTFGPQIEHRRIAAGLGSESISTPGRVASPGLGAAVLPADAPAPGEDLDASSTMMLRSDGSSGMMTGEEEGLGPRTRMVVLVASFAFIAAGVLTLIIRPDLLQGGTMDDKGQYIEPGAEDDGADASVDDTEAASGDGTGGGTGAEADDAEGTGSAPDTESPPATDGEPQATDGGGADVGKPKDDGKGKPKDDGKGKPKDDGKGKPKDGKGKGKPKDDVAPPPPDLDELFKQPGR